MQNIAESVQWQVKYLLCNLNAKKSLKPCTDEIHRVLQMSGNKFEHLLLQLPLELLDVKDPKIQSGGKDQAKMHFLTQEVARLSSQPAFLRLVPIALENLNIANIAEYVLDLFKCLKLQIHEQIVFLVALSHTSNTSYRTDTIKLLKNKLKEYYGAGKPQPLPAYAAHKLLLMLLSSNDFSDDPLFQRDIAQFIRDSMCKSAQAHPFELDPFFASRFSPYHSLSEDITMHAPSPPTILAQPQTGHLVDLVDLLIDCEPSISHNYGALMGICSDYKDKDFTESKMADFLIKLANSVSASIPDEKPTKPSELNPAGLYFQTVKPNLKINGAPASSVIPLDSKTWNIENLAKALREISGKINWDKVVDSMDKPTLLNDAKAFQFMLNLFVKCRQGPFPVSRLLTQWKNQDTQTAMLEYALSIQDLDYINFESTPNRQARIDGIQGLKPNVMQTLHAWCSIDLVQTLIELSDSSNYMRIRNIFEFPLKNCPEYLTLTIAQAKPKGGQFLLDELYGVLLPIFLANHVNSIIVIEGLWNINPRLVMRSICNLYKFDPTLMNLSRVLDITQEIKELLKAILSLDCYEFTIPLAVLAGKRDFLHFDAWMIDRIKAVGEPFIISLLSYLDESIVKKSKDPVAAASDTPEKRLEKSYLSVEKLAAIFENLKKQKSLPEWLLNQIDTMHKEIINLFPGMVQPTNESPEIEDEANRWFQRVFMGEIPVEELIKRMKAYKESKEPKQSEIYACMIHNLLDEYRFFGKYPEKELKITGQLFGSIIQHKLVDSLLEKISLKYVFEALKRSGKMLRFGVYALEQFIDRLKEWPASVDLILKMKNFKDAYPELYNKIYQISQNLPRPTASTTPTTSSQQGVTVEGAQQMSPIVPQMESPVTSPLPTPPFAPLPNASQAPSLPPSKPQQTFSNLSQQSPPLPPGYQPANYTGRPYMYAPQPSIPPPGTVPYGWQGNPPGMAPQPNPFQPMTKTLSVPSRHEPLMSGMPTRPTDYQQFLRNVGDKDFASEFQGHPQNPPTSHIPTLVEGSETAPKPSAIPRPMDGVKPPSEFIMGKINLAMNMMAGGDYMKIKEDMQKYIETDPNTLTWLAHTIVDRATSQANNHQLYIKFINSLQNKTLSNMVLNITANQIKTILEIYKGNNEPDDKAKKSVKNLAIFFGLMTLADNKPILTKDLDLKQILIEGYESGGIALPLIVVCQILRQSEHSKVFRPNNPWMRAIFSLLQDLLQTQTFITNFGLRSEIKLLHEHLKIDQNHYPPAKIIVPKATVPMMNKPIPVYQSRHPAPPVSMPGMPPQMRPQYLQPMSAPFRGTSPQPQITAINVSPEIGKVLQSIDPNYMEIIKKAIDTSVNDILKPVIERSVTIALITTREIVLKDFALEPSDKKLLEATNQMIQCLAGSLAMVTCREPLRMSMGNRLKDVLKRYELPQKDYEQFVKTLCNDNLDIGSTHIQKSVISKAKARVREDQAIMEALEMRNPENPMAPLTYNTPKAVPEALRPKKEGLTQAELDVYKEFNRVLKENTTPTMPTSGIPSDTSTDQSEEGHPKAYRITETMINIQKIIDANQLTNPDLPALIARFGQDLQEIARNYKILDQVTKEIFKSLVILYKVNDKQIKEKSKFYLQLLYMTMGFYKPLPSRITEQLFKESPDEIKYNFEFVASLFRSNMIDTSVYDAELSEALRNISNMPPEPSNNLLTFVANLVLSIILTEKLLQPAQLTNTFMAMNTIHKTAKAQDNPAFASMLMNLSTSDKNTKGLASQLFEEWVNLNQDQSPELLHEYFQKLSSHLSSDERFVGFFKAALEAAVQQTLFSIVPSPNGGNAIIPNYHDRLDFRLIDSVLKLLFTLLPYKLSMCSKYFFNFMRALIDSLKTEHQQKPSQFNQRPYYRFFVIILQSLKKPEVKMLPHDEMLVNIAQALHEIAPRYCPGFAFAWLDLVSHRNFMPHMMSGRPEENPLSSKMVPLLCDMFEFLKFVLPLNEQPPGNVCMYFEAVLRISVVLLHDFPDFLALYYLDLLAVLPEQCIQLRNIILSAIPKNIKAPDPKLRIKVDKIPEQKTPPIILSSFKHILSYRNIKEDVDKYIATSNPSLLLDICNKLMTPEAPNRPKRPDLEIFHAFILYMAELYIANEPVKKEPGITAIFTNMLSKLDPIAREQLINVMFNEIRYPNSYTHYFICFLLYLMENCNIPLVQEQIFRILLERETVHLPVPWGITIFSKELRNNATYDLLNKPFVKGVREIETLLLGKQGKEQAKED